jgi:virulence-associated protein VapD
VLAVQAASKEWPWLKRCVTDIRMLRIEENNNLYQALGDDESIADYG